MAAADVTGPGRRLLLRGASLVLALAAARPARAQLLPGSATLLAPGPETGPLAAWAAHATAMIGRAATTAVRIEPEYLGGQDGVTAANRFAASATPDGRTLLVMPGAAALARLVGETRARFDPGGWVPVSASLSSGVVAGRYPLSEAPSRTPIRLAIGVLEGPCAAALLALDLLQLAAAPAQAGRPVDQSLQEGSADAGLLLGPDVPAQLASYGLHPWFTLDGNPGERDPRLPETPTLAELVTGPAELLMACQAVGAAARLVAALMLPALTPSDMVALWRAAATRWVEEDVAGQPDADRRVAGAEAAQVTTALAPNAGAILGYREWLLRRLNWRAN